MSVALRPTTTTIEEPLMEHTGPVPKRATADVEKSRPQSTYATAGRDADARTDIALNASSHSTDVKVNAPNCTKE